MIDLQYSRKEFRFVEIIILFELVSHSFFIANGGWRVGDISYCSYFNNGTGIGIKSFTKFCDNPVPEGGNLCPCNHTDLNEINCNGIVATIQYPCKSMICKF